MPRPVRLCPFPPGPGVVHATYTISPTLLNEAAFNFNGNDLNITDFGLYQKPSGYTVKNFFNANNDNKLPGISIGSPYNVSYTPGWWPWNNTWRSYQVKDDLLLDSRHAQPEVRRVLDVHP